MQSFKKIRKNAKAAITRTQTWVTQNLDSENDLFLLQTKLHNLETEITKYINAQDEIEELDLEGSDKEDRDSLQNNFDLSVSSLRKKIHSLTVPPSPPAIPNSIQSASAVNDQGGGIKLPQISIFQFAGDYAKWAPFYQLFTALIKNNNSSNDVQKLIYLRSYMKGEPLSLIESLEITNENFQIAINILEKRYENSLAIINSHLNSIVDCPNVTKCTSSSLREFLVNIRRNLDALKNLKCPIEHWDLIILNIVMKKLDYGTKKEYQSNRDLKINPTMKEFFEIIGARCSALESLAPPSHAAPLEFKSERVSKTSSKTALHVNSSSPSYPTSKRRTCWFCEIPEHDIYKCHKFSNINTDEKYSFLRSLSLCFNCLGGRHLLTECKSKGCSLCGRKHHTLLHKNSNQGSVPKNSQNSNYSPRDSPRPQISTGAIPKLVQNTTSSQNWRSPSRNSPTPNADRTAQFRAFEPESQENSSAPSMPSALLVGKEDHEILLATAVVYVLSENGCPVKARLILDNGILPVITSKLPRIPLNKNILNIPLEFGLADPEFHIPSDVDMLLGADAYYDILLPQIHRLGPKLLTLQLTRLGWVIGGHLPPQIIPKQNKVSLLCQNACEAGDSLDKILAKFWEVEELPEYKSLSADEELAEQSFIQTHVRLENGTFQVDFPFKRPGEKIPLGDSFHIAQKALLRQTYVDDVLHGADSLAELKDSYHQLNMLLNSAGFRLHKWSSNSSQFREKYFSALSTEAFLLTLKRFISRRGISAVIHSDNATNYVGARNHLRELREFFAKSQLSESLKVFAAETGFDWKFIPPRSPHWGGLWEAAVKGAKRHLYRIIGNSQLTFEELSTVLAQIEAILNSRPLCPISSDPKDLEVLTPGHFLIGRSLTSYPKLDATHLPENRLAFWQRCSQIQQSFWKRWTVEYLNRLQNRPKWLSPAKNLEINELVLLKEDDVPPLKWPLAQIVEIIPGSDQRVRAVKLRTKKSVFVRPITKVCPLPSAMQQM
ncbi:hypothetical protein JTB14_026804 [Gonioctena quinquepunctata]|nr:hypothetical protein JTB14_026804 [Gonioctena quinquepunctata]